MALWIVLLLSASSLFAQNPARARALAPGPHLVGYRLVQQPDPTRSFAGHEPRVISIRLWYPAAPNAGTAPVPYGRMLNVLTARGTPRASAAGELHARSLAVQSYAVRHYAGADSMGLHTRLQATPSNSYLNAVPKSGRFPVIVYGGGAGMPVDENTLLYEYLASNGYVVATVPAMGAHDAAVTLDAPGLEAEARDLEVVYGHLRNFPNADVTRVATMGFSWGGAAALVVAMRNPAVRAVVLLDAAHVAPFHIAKIRRSTSFEDENLRVPLLDIHAVADGISDDVVDGLRYSARTVIEIPGFDHIDFIAYGSTVHGLLGARADSALQAKTAGYRAMARTVLTFLDDHVADKGTFAGKDADWRAYPEDVRIRTYAALPPPMTAQQLRALITERGIDAARTAYEELRRRDPRAPVLREAELNALGYALLEAKTREAAEVFLWNARAYPASANVWDGLADAYVTLKDVACAAAAYREMLERLPRDGSLIAAQKSAYAQRARNYLAQHADAGTCAVRLP